MKKNLLFIFTILTVGLGMLLVYQPAADAQECIIVRIDDGEKSIRVQPETLNISKGTCVIWVNWSATRKVDIMFEKGKVCEDVVEASMDFKLGEGNCFITKVMLAKGGTASLVYEKEGSFDYVAKPDSGEGVKGKIVVK